MAEDRGEKFFEVIGKVLKESLSTNSYSEVFEGQDPVCELIVTESSYVFIWSNGDIFILRGVKA